MGEVMPDARILLLVLAAACAPDARVALSEARPVSAPTTVGAAPMLAVAPSGHRATAWVSAPGGGSDGRLYVAVDSGIVGAAPAPVAPVELRDPLGPVEAHGEAPPKIAYGADGALYALYVVGREVPGRRFPMSALRFSRSADGGRTWTAPASVTDAAEFGSYNFHSLHVAPDGAVYVAWLDGRHGKSAAYVTHSTDGGRTWAANTRMGAGEACPCCRTAVAAGTGGVVYAAWRSVAAGNVRDIVVARSEDGGRTWGEARTVHDDRWVFDGCPHAGPALQVDSGGRLHATWWTGKAEAAGVYYAHSDDGGRTFSEPAPLGTAGFSRPAHVQLALGDGGTVLVAWDDGTTKLPRVQLRVSRDRGARWSASEPLSADDRVATFPVLAVSGRRLTVAWSEESPSDAEREAQSHPNMKDPKATMGLPRVGRRQVVVREGTFE
jgi:hypothetical protein